MGTIRLLRGFFSLEQSLVPAAELPTIWATERQTSAVIPNPNAELRGNEQRLPSSFISFACRKPAQFSASPLLMTIRQASTEVVVGNHDLCFLEFGC